MTAGSGMRRVWGRPTSSNVMKVVWLLEELGLAYQRIDAGGAFGVTDTPAYRAMNPNGLIPTLQEDDLILWESHAILRYLAETAIAATPLWPQDPRARAVVNQWLDWCQTTLTGPQGSVFVTLVRTPEARRDQPALQRAIGQAGAAWALLDRALAASLWVAGDGMTLADIGLGVHVHRWFALPIDRPETPHLFAWYQRLRERPAYLAHVARPLE